MLAPQLIGTPVTRAAFPEEVMAHAVAPEAIAGVIAFLVSDAAAPVSGAILPTYGLRSAVATHRGRARIRFWAPLVNPLLLCALRGPSGARRGW